MKRLAERDSSPYSPNLVEKKTNSRKLAVTIPSRYAPVLRLPDRGGPLQAPGPEVVRYTCYEEMLQAVATCYRARTSENYRGNGAYPLILPRRGP
jgi:hypothetical protein